MLAMAAQQNPLRLWLLEMGILGAGVHTLLPMRSPILTRTAGAVVWAGSMPPKESRFLVSGCVLDQSLHLPQCRASSVGRNVCLACLPGVLAASHTALSVGLQKLMDMHNMRELCMDFKCIFFGPK